MMRVNPCVWKVAWTLRSGCGALVSNQYEAAFHENGVDETVLPKLTAEDVKDLGVTAVGASQEAA